MAANFVLSVGVIAYFSTRLIAERERREHELALLRERFTRDEGIVALATHAASVAHELNTPLATLMMLVDELETQPDKIDLGDLASMRQLLALCRERVRALARPADPAKPPDGLELGRLLTQWQLVRPGIALINTMSGHQMDSDEAVREKFGVSAAQIVDLLTLMPSPTA